ncbi:MAG: hypothetical protein NTZ93_03990 [Candidatus Beckwithbacteria bacterium]|nr:hypothetical protein [Candidatus Beckwithbacteria bacterium]
MKTLKLDFKTVKKQVDTLASDKAAKNGLRLLFAALGVSWLWLGGWWHKLPPEVPLFYSLAYGEGRLADRWELWLLPALMLLVDLISIKAAGNLIEKDKLLAQILVWIAAIITTMMLIALVKIVFLIT